MKYSFLDVTVNGVQVLSHDSQWSSEHQVPFELKPGLNTLEVEFRQLRGRSPAVHLYDSLGQPLASVRLPVDAASLQELATAWNQANAALGDALRVRAAPGLQFVPKILRVKAGANVRLIFENPDLMVHNFVLVAAGAGEDVGALADLMAANPQGMSKGYIPVSPKILHATPLVHPKSHAELLFKAPSVPGRYPYLCTFPGHWKLMRGELVVE